ncbi:AAA family ATPase [Paenibacillus sp. P46E]|uniref:AAA family ATPase n=1 Tax=Paenibacillus sp. P46E TaxID=1349436 RepID=UPI002115F3F3|nr:AAA family ATPase [Paenibacillus sp. P46E]
MTLSEPKTELKLIHMEDVKTKEVNWLWYPYIRFGKITVIEGDPGEGKTTLILKTAALLSKGLPLPCTDGGHLSDSRGRIGGYYLHLLSFW